MASTFDRFMPGERKGITAVIVALKVLLVILCLALIAVVLLQSSRSAGLSGAISGGAEQLIGRKARGIDAFFQRATVVLGTLFLLVSLSLAWLIVHQK
jgi:preprotein translocase subunit SecG